MSRLSSNARGEPKKSTCTEWSTTRSTGTSGSMIFGSRPSRCTALRIAARSTISGTPVKSCKTMRATTNGISALAGDFAFHFASASTSLRPTFFPSQLRSTDSSTIRMLTGNREILPISCSSRAGSEKNNPSRPLPASNFLSVLNSSVMVHLTTATKDMKAKQFQNFQNRSDLCVLCARSFQFFQFRFDLLEIWQLPRVVITLGELNPPVLGDDERRAFRHASHAKVHLRQERVVHHAIFLCDLMVVVAQQRHRDLLFLRPCFLRKRIIAANSINSSVQTSITIQARTGLAHFRGARARERHRKEKQQGVSFPEILAQPDLFGPVGRFCR